jgi:hypothetical protein
VTRTHVVVETSEPVVRRTIKGKVHENHFRTVDASTLTPIGNGQATLPDGTVVTVRGNEMTVTYDSDGLPMRFQATIREQYPNISRARESSETRAQSDAAQDGRRGIDHDQAPDQSYDGGHAAGHQFFPGLGRDNMFPQESGFNRHVYTQLEREMAAWANAGAHVDLRVELVVTRHGGFEPTSSYDVDGSPVQQVPDRLSVQVKYSDADGNVVAFVRGDFFNVPGQAYDFQPPTAEQQAQLAGSSHGR